MTATQNAPAEVSSRLVEQDRGYAAMRAIGSVAKSNQTEYQRRAKQLPAMIQNLGLAGTLAFLLSKRDADKLLADHLAKWLLSAKARVGWSQVNVDDPPGAPGILGAELQKAICKIDTDALHYRRASHEARLYAGWLKRWSTVKFGEEEGTGDSNAE